MKLEKSNWTRELWISDNLPVMRGMNSETVDLIYLDPPFNSKRMYEGNLSPEMGKQSFSDIWGDSDITEDDRRILRTEYPHCAALINVLADSHGKSWKSYLSFMGIRLMEMHRLLKETGSIYLHCDPHMSHPLKMLMDMIFGEKNFRNEIVWCYTRMSTKNQMQLSRAHDIIFWYSKTSNKNWKFNVDDIRLPYADSSKKREGMTLNRLGSGYSKEGITVLNPKGKFPEDWIRHIPYLRQNERTGWKTQKPLALLERIIKASSNKGDVVMDPFCGCGTACIAATRLERQWLGIDQHPSADKIMQKRIQDDTKLAPEWDSVKIIHAKTAADLPKRTDVQSFIKNAQTKRMLYETQKGKCASGDLCPNGAEKQNINLMDFDRKMPGKRGGGYVWGNVQLLCRTCNGKKGKKTWKVFLDSLRRAKAAELLEGIESPE